MAKGISTTGAERRALYKWFKTREIRLKPDTTFGFETGPRTFSL